MAQDTGYEQTPVDRGVAELTEGKGLSQRRLAAAPRRRYDFIVCGSGSSGSVVAGRLAENPAISVLLIEAGGSDEAPQVMQAHRWLENLATEREWGFHAQPNPHLDGRALPMAMGKVLGGGSSINGMYWVRGHKSDWDFFAAEANDPAWSHASISETYRRIEDWQGKEDVEHRGTGGPVFVRPTDLRPLGEAMIESVRAAGVPAFENLNGLMTESGAGCAKTELLSRGDRRVSIFRSYVFPRMHQMNLTVLTSTMVTRLIIERGRVIGVEIVVDGTLHRVAAGLEVVLSLGAINTPKLLMQSGIGDQAELHRLGIDVIQHLPGVGKNFQDHILLGCCLWEHRDNLEGPALPQIVIFEKSDPLLETPDMQLNLGEGARVGPDMATFDPPKNLWRLVPILVRPKSRGQLRLMGSGPRDPIQIEANTFQDPDDMKATRKAVEMCRELGASAALRPFVMREVAPGKMSADELESFIRRTVATSWHQSCTAKMGCDRMAVVDGCLRVYGISNLRIADGSIMPRVTTGNTMAPCVAIGERAAEMLRTEHGA